MRSSSTRSGQRASARALSLVIFLGLAVVGALVFFQTQNTDPAPAADPDDPGVARDDDPPVAEGDDWELPSAGAGAPSTDATAGLPAPDPVTEATMVFGGSEVAAGETVSTRIPYRKGDRHRYQLTNTVRGEDKASGNARGRRETRWLTVEVVDVTDDGAARVAVTFDAVRVQMLLSADFGFTFDSRDPDPRTLANPQVAALVKPLVALLHTPVEYELTADGQPVRVHGVDALAEKFVEAAGPRADPASVPTEEQFLRDLGGMLFPATGRELVAGTGRPYVRLEDTTVRYDIRHEGTIDVVRADPGVCVVQATATPKIERRTGPPRGDNEAAVVEGHIVAGADSTTGRWRIDRENRRVDKAELRASYELWISFKGGSGNPAAGVGKDFTPTFTIIDQLTTLQHLPRETAAAPPGGSEETQDGPDQGAAPAGAGSERQASTDGGASPGGADAGGEDSSSAK